MAKPGTFGPLGIVLGKNARKIIDRGDMACSFQYVNEEEAACFYPLFRTRDVAAADKPGAYIVCLSSAYKYADDKYAVRQARTAAVLMGFDENSKQVVHKIAGFIQDMLIELLAMKPMPDELRRDLVTIDNVTVGERGAHIELATVQ